MFQTQDLPAAIEAWTDSFLNLLKPKQLQRLDPKVNDRLLSIELFLHLDTFHNLLTYYRDNAAPYHPSVTHLIENKCIFEKLTSLQSKSKSIKPTAVKTEQNILRPRPNLFVADESEKKVDEEANGLYKAPKNFQVHYKKKDKKSSNMLSDDDDDGEENEDVMRLKRSEFVKAITEDLLDTPKEIGNGEEELPTKQRKLLKRLREEEKYESSNLTRIKRNKGADKAYKALRQRQNELSVGSRLSDMSSFVDKILRDK